MASNATVLPVVHTKHGDKHKQQSHNIGLLPPLQPGTEIKLETEGKFERGYLVSLQIGSEVLRGVVFEAEHISPYEISSTTVSSSSRPPVPTAPAAPRIKRERRGRKDVRPKRKSGYNFFFSERYGVLKAQYSNRHIYTDLTKMIGDEWTNLPEENRKVYNNYALQDMERYKREMKEYNKKLLENMV